MRPPVVGRRDGPEPFLARSVPDLQLHGLAVQLHSLDLEINTNGGDVVVRVRVVREPQQQTGLTYTTIAYQQQLEQIIVLAIHNYYNGKNNNKQ